MATTSSTTGINVSGISKIEDAIKAYRNKIKKSFDLTQKKAQVEAAIKGTGSEQDLKKYMTHIDEQVKAYLKYLDDSIDQLKGINAKYSSNDKQNKTFSGQIPKYTKENK